MTRITQFSLSIFASVSIAAPALAAAPVAEGGRKFDTVLNGANECNAAGTCNLGDTDGTGTAHIVVNYGQNRVCWTMTANNIAAPTRSHIHKGPATGAGPIVVSFFETAATADLESCTTAALDADLVKDIIQNPQDYYVNIHNAVFPGGAIRGQLGK
jgi:hypothetical protein